MDKKNYIVGVDIGSSNVVMIVGTRGTDGLLNIDGIASRSVAGGVTSGRIDNVRSVGMAIRGAKEELEEELNIRITEAYAGISGNFIRCANYTDHVFIKDSSNCITKEDVAALHERMRNVSADYGEQIMDRIPQNYMVDDGCEIDDPVGSFGRKLSSTFLFILCSKEQLERVRMSFHNAGLKCMDICVNPVVTQTVLLSDEERDEGVAVIDIGGGTTDVTILRSGKLRYVASVPIGASAIDADIHTFGIAKIHAEQIKKKYGSAISDKVSPDITIPVQMPGQTKKDFIQFNLVAIIEARLKDIIEFAWEEIRNAKFSTKIPCGIVLTGGSALLDNIDELFQRETGANVRLGVAEYGVDEESRQRIGTFAHSTAVAILKFGADHGFCAVIDRSLVGKQPSTDDTAKIVTSVSTAQPNVASRNEAPCRDKKIDDMVECDSEESPAEMPTNDVPETIQKEMKSGNANSDEHKSEVGKSGLLSKLSRWFDTVLGENGDNEYL